nr:hypothetical protein [Burkholderia pseudomultivorans]
MFCGRSVERGEGACEREFGTAVTFVAADLARVEDCRAVIAAAAEPPAKSTRSSMLRR